MELNHGPLVSKATALPTEPQPLPTCIINQFKYAYDEICLTRFWAHTTRHIYTFPLF